MAETYQVHNIYLKAADFYILILEYPGDEVSDKLTILSTDRGLIYKTFYEDFVLNTCMANAGSFFYHIRRRMELLEKFSDIREEVLEAVYKINPGFFPDNIVGNTGGVFKAKADVRPGEQVRPIQDNDLWDREPPLASFGPALITSAPLHDNESPFPILDSENSDLGDGKDDLLQDPFIKDVNSDDGSGGDVMDIPYELVGHRWPKAGIHINLRKYEEVEGATASLLGGTPFETVKGYHLLIVKICIEDFADIFHLLDSTGVSKKTPPNVLIEELYEMAILYNPFLKFENVDIPAIRKDFKEKQQTKTRNRKTASFASKEAVKGDPSKGPKFADVSKERLSTLAVDMKKRVIGQDEAIDAICDAVIRSSVGLKRAHQPVGAFLFMGYTGTGKSETAKALADVLCGGSLVRIDCQEYQQPHEVAKLGGCFVPGTPVVLGNGGVKSIEDVRIGEEVISHTGHRRKVLETFEYDYEGGLIEFKSVGSNLPIQVTPNHEIPIIRTSSCSHKGREHVICKPTCFRASHPVQTCSTHYFEDYKLEWVAAKDVSVGDIVIYPRYKSDQDPIRRLDLAEVLSDEDVQYDATDVWVLAHKHTKPIHRIPRYIEINEDFMRLAGYYVSDGGKNSKLKKGINFAFPYDETAYQEEVILLIKKIFGGDMEFYRPPQEEIDGKLRKRGTFSSKVVGLLFTKLFGEKNSEKHVPGWFLDLPDALLREFLTTSIFGDGTVTKKRNVEHKTISFSLHSQLKTIFSKLGYVAQTFVEKYKDKRSGYEGIVYCLRLGGDQIVCVSEEFTDLKIDLAGFGHSNIQRMAYTDMNYIYTQVKEKNVLSYSGKVYDIKVSEDASYVVHNFAVHNSPPGYVGYEDGGHLTRDVVKKPFSVVLLDEVEKAHSNFHERILQILDDGILTDNKGRKVSFADTIIIMTSNIGVKDVGDINKTVGFGDSSIWSHDKQKGAYEGALKKKFKPEFINRIDEMITFRRLERSDYLEILDVMLREISEQLNTKQKLTMQLNSAAKNFILDKGIDRKFGARPLWRTLKKYVTTPLAKAIISGEIKEGEKISASLAKDGESLTFVSKNTKVITNDVAL